MTGHVFSLIKESVILGKSYIIWICVHYAASNLYIYYCSPKTPMGFLMSPFYAISPHCKVIYWFFDTSRLSITNMWQVFVLWGISKCNNIL